MIIINEITVMYDNDTEQEEIKKHRVNHLEDIESQDSKYTYFKHKSILRRNGDKWKETITR